MSNSTEYASSNRVVRQKEEIGMLYARPNAYAPTLTVAYVVYDTLFKLFMRTHI